MWILSSDGDFFQGKSVWLRPGKKYLFGRIKEDGVRHAIQNASISRKHLVIEVSSVKPGDGSRLHTKSELTVSDQGTKCGTTVDGEQIKRKSKTLSGNEHTIRLGKYQHAFRIKWTPTVLSFSFSTKELKAKDPLAPVRARLEDLDIKTAIPYVVGKTTHVVQNKRNTAKGLQALINGKYIVQDSYINALVYAATPSDLENLESLSPLEEDFYAAWPDPRLHFPPAGKEPIQRPATAFAPNPTRLYVFEGFTFVFCDAAQFENLQAPINNGHGKALLYAIENGKTTATELVQFMRNAAGRKGARGDDDENGKAVLVRFRAKGSYEEWSVELGNQVALMMDRRVIEQSEFLDAILGNDASPLYRALPREEQETPNESDVRPSSHANTPPEVLSHEQPASQLDVDSSQAPKKPATRQRVGTFQSKVKTFDDGFDMDSIPTYTPDETVTEGPREASPPAIAINRQEPEQNVSRTHSDEDEVISGLLPGAQAMKRRRAEQPPRDREVEMAQAVAPKPKRQKVDVLEAARQRREAEDSAVRQQRQDEEASHAAIQDMTLGQMKKLAVIEEMEVPLIHGRTIPSTEEGSRWDERWNGRKNFKRFHRNGDAHVSRHRVQPVIVPLEEIRQKNFGIGDHYWAGSNHESVDEDSRPSQHERRDRDPVAATSQRETTGSPEPSGRTETSSTRLPRSRKRGREARDSDSGEEPRFRFRRKQ